MQPLFRKVDCLSLKVSNIDSAISFYRSKLGHELIWKTETAAGLAMPDTDTELVVHTDARPSETELLVASVPEATKLFVEAGGTLVKGPFEIQIGLCAVVSDPWNNEIVILDMSKGKVNVDMNRNVIGGA
jgi:lactoylglutathione lyase